jgi:hypothetical protein
MPLIKFPNATEPPRRPRRENRLWHNSTRHTLSLGCTLCPERNLCGGLQIGGAAFDCLSFCRCNAATGSECDAVCPNTPTKFADYVREVDGFHLDNVPRVQAVPVPRLPRIVPLFQDKRKNITFHGAPMVAVPLYEVIHRHDRTARYSDAAQLRTDFGLPPETGMILSGTAKDAPLERWWSLGVEGRRDVIQALRSLRIALVTTPNYSLFTDQPRWDDLHSIKRIAIVHEEFLREGVAAALHVNARTDRDWERWCCYIQARPEITHIAFEFATGAGYGSRILWHADRLAWLAAKVDRPLHVIVRGGTKVLPALAAAFTEVVFIDTTVFAKTIHRQQANISAGNKIEWLSAPTVENAPLGSLFENNWNVVAASFEALLSRQTSPLQAAG